MEETSSHCVLKGDLPFAELSLPQAQIMAELFGGRLALLSPPRPCTLGALQVHSCVSKKSSTPQNKTHFGIERKRASSWPQCSIAVATYRKQSGL